MSEQLNENPLIAALMGALVGMGLERNKAQQAAQQAVDQAAGSGGAGGGAAASAPATGGTYTDVMKQGSRGEGVKQLQQKLGMTQADGIFGPNTVKAVKTFQQSQGLKVDGIVGPETKARIDRMAGDGAATRTDQAPIDGGIAPGTTQAGQPSRLRQRQQSQARNASANNNQAQADAAMGRTTQNASKENKGNQINEEITISGDAEDLIRLMQLAGAGGAKAVDANDINQDAKPCPICGKIHGPSQPMGGCGSKPKEPGMGDMIKMMAPGEAMEEAVEEGEDKINNPAYLDIIKNLLMRAKSTEEFKDYLNNEMDKDPKFGQWMNFYAKETALGKRAINVYFGRDVIGEDEGPMGDEYDDEPSAPDETYMNDVSASIPHGDDLHKKKRSYKATAGGDNPMTLEDELRARLSAALAEKKQ